MLQVENPIPVIENFLAHAQQKLGDDAFLRAQPFLKQYLSQVDPDDLEQRSAEDLAGAALCHWQLIHQREVAGEPSVHIYNPQRDRDGWQSQHTVLQIVNDDMPFLVDSVTMELNRRGLTVHLIIHPVMQVQRDAKGLIAAVHSHAGRIDSTQYESFIHIELDYQADAVYRDDIAIAVRKILLDVRNACIGYADMKTKCSAHIEKLQQRGTSNSDCTEAVTFLQWLKSDHFTFLGYRDCNLIQVNGKAELHPVINSELGILKNVEYQNKAIVLSDAAQAALANAGVVFITQSNLRSTIHRPGFLDYIGIKHLDENGAMVGESHFLGLFTSSAMHERPHEVPLLRQKVQNVVERAGLLSGSHIHKTLISILENYPRQDLFQMNADELFEIATGILRLQERQRIRLFLRRDPLMRFYTGLVFLPRDKFNTDVRLKIQTQLEKHLQGSTVEFTPSLSESMLARLYFVIRTSSMVDIDVREIEAELAKTIRGWDDDFSVRLNEHFGGKGTNYARKWANILPTSYREFYTASEAVADVAILESLDEADPLGVSLYIREGRGDDELRFKLFQMEAPIPLYKALPMLDMMGVKVLDEHPYTLNTPNGICWLHDLGLKLRNDIKDLSARRDNFHTLFQKVWQGEVESDDFNQLALVAGIEWRQIVVFRSYAKYFRQIGFNFSQSYIEQTLIAYPKIVQKLWQLFDLRFNPAAIEPRTLAVEQQVATISEDLEEITNLDEDRILRQYLEVIQATLRTNFYQTTPEGSAKPYVSFKLNPSLIPGVPEPKPMFEIFVYSPRVEGVHLRGGKVARGGLRWSDRREDFRTEILGLVKAQMVKNTVIVPVGSKGGFVLKQAPSAQDREAFMKEGIDCYKTFLRGLLDVTDNLVKGEVVPPVNVVRHDADDPYLVVAADKGTATFSDTANGIADEYGFWLGDAFASGGSVGYDHKKMGITARGAWESVKRHFRAQGRNTQTTPITVVGVGDMSGDVFGNGMLLSPHITLVAAFDHRHIFIDPTPDVAKSFAERQRMFDLPRSSWADYSKELISKGGGIYPRSEKFIDLSEQARAALGISGSRVTPIELMKGILQAPVDLLYNGGIGTYVKASSETNAQVGDRANDVIRVNGSEVRARVIAEGGNLGCTQQGRIEYAVKGGAIYTDAIDNSAGVDCSDHEVNIKILVNRLQESGQLTQQQRNQLLFDMTDEVGHLVLEDNYYQTQSISRMVAQKDQYLDVQGLWMDALEASGRLNRALEGLPSQAVLDERKAKHTGLTSPEHAVLMAYTKMALFDEMLASNLPDDKALLPVLHRYFPNLIQTRFGKELESHPLNREIITTSVVNQMVNRVGSTFVFRIRQALPSVSSAAVIAAYWVVKEALRLDETLSAIDQLDNVAADALQIEMLNTVAEATHELTLWLLGTHPEGITLSDYAPRYQLVFDRLKQQWVSLLPTGQKAVYQAEVTRLHSQSVPESLAEIIALLPSLKAILRLVSKASADLPIERITSLYFALGEHLHYAWLQKNLDAWKPETVWQEQAKNTLLQQLLHTQREITVSLFQNSSEEQDNTVLLTQWESERATELKDYQKLVDSLQTQPSLDLSMLTVTVHALSSLL
ncbi:MAG: NAD-glutamate dehydrogenase [Pseudomonadota bacterium]